MQIPPPPQLLRRQRPQDHQPLGRGHAAHRERLPGQGAGEAPRRCHSRQGGGKGDQAGRQSAPGPELPGEEGDQLPAAGRSSQGRQRGPRRLQAVEEEAQGPVLRPGPEDREEEGEGKGEGEKEDG